MLCCARFKWLFVSLLFISLIFIFIFILQISGVRIVYQHSLSMPMGYYFIYPTSKYSLNDTILIEPDVKTMNLLLARRYLLKKSPLLKVIKATKGDLVCYQKEQVLVNETETYPLYSEDKKGNLLPRISFCSKLKQGEYFVIGVSSKYSFDSRYFGLIGRNQILGKALKL